MIQVEAVKLCANRLDQCIKVQQMLQHMYVPQEGDVCKYSSFLQQLYLNQTESKSSMMYGILFYFAFAFIQ